MSVTAEDVRSIARLARLEVNDTEVDFYTRQLSRILELVAQMNDAATDDVAPLAHPLDTPARLRDDVVTETDQRAAMQSVAPAMENGLYLVPRVIE